MNFVKNFLKNHRKIVYLVLILAALFILITSILAAKVTLEKRKEHRDFDRQTQKLQADLEKPYREDIYGGKTPEETWGLFLDALKKGDIDLASKYFAVEKQGEMKNRFEESIKLNRLQSSIKIFSGEFKKEKDYLQGEKAYFFIPIKNTNKEIEAYPVVFYFNPYTQIWKILVL